MDPMKMRLVLRLMKGLIFIHATTLWRFHEIMRKIAVTDRYQP